MKTPVSSVPDSAVNTGEVTYELGQGHRAQGRCDRSRGTDDSEHMEPTAWAGSRSGNQ